MSGGGSDSGGGQPTYTPAPKQEIQPVPQASFPTTGYGGVGYTQVPQTYTQEAMPTWMQGGQMDLGAQGYGGMSGASKGAPNWFQMPQWGLDAATGQPLTQEQLQPEPYEPPQQPQPQPQSQPQPSGAIDYAAPSVDPIQELVTNQLQAGLISQDQARQMLGISVAEANQMGLPGDREYYQRNIRYGLGDTGIYNDTY